MTAPIEMMLDGVSWVALPAREASKDGIPHATHEGILTFAKGVSLRCYQLSNGQRVFDADDVAAFFGVGAP